MIATMKTGRCACESVRYEITAELVPVTYCHCSKCRRWHGHVSAWTAVERAGFRLVEERGLKWHAMSATVRRGFCGECGSSLLWDDAGDARMSICAGTLDAPTGLREKAHIFVGSKGDYYALPDDGLPRHEEYK
jgi:hypothetical protein